MSIVTMNKAEAIARGVEMAIKDQSIGNEVQSVDSRCNAVLAALLAMLTSPAKDLREAAKKEIRHYAAMGKP